MSLPPLSSLLSTFLLPETLAWPGILWVGSRVGSRVGRWGPFLGGPGLYQDTKAPVHPSTGWVEAGALEPHGLATSGSALTSCETPGGGRHALGLRFPGCHGRTVTALAWKHC